MQSTTFFGPAAFYAEQFRFGPAVSYVERYKVCEETSRYPSTGLLQQSFAGCVNTTLTVSQIMFVHQNSVRYC